MFKLVVNTDKDIGRLYRSLIPKYYRVAPQMYSTHVTLVRNEVPPNLEAWGKYEGQGVSFLYSRIIQNDENYWWLNVFSNKFERIREELGLSKKDQYTLPPESFISTFHLTIGNTKDIIRYGK